MRTRDVLQVAGDLAGGARRLPGVAGPRATCLVARQALELVVADLLRSRDLCPSCGSMRSRLICLAVAYEDRPEVARRAKAAWAGLSNACHHHAYELAPTAGEAAALLDEVVWLNAIREQATSSTSDDIRAGPA